MSNRNFLDMGGSPPPIAIDCSVVGRMLEAGTRHLTEQALDELADHLESCPGCLANFDAVYSDGGEGEGSATDAQPPSMDLGSRLVSEVLDYIEGLRQLSKVVTFVPVPSKDAGLGSGPSVGQLARGQVLRAQVHSFMVGEMIGCGNFTETYAATQVPVKGVDPRDWGRRAVIKIPRVADDMSPDAASDRLRLLCSLVRVHAQDLKNLTGLHQVAEVMDCGEYVHRLRDREERSAFVAYEYIDGEDLASCLAQHHSIEGQFCGLPTASDFSRWARMLADGLAEIHNRLVIHGDVCPRNILVTNGQPIFIDAGQFLFREVMNGAGAYSRNFYRAPDAIGAPSSDLFSLGGLLYYLATGREPFGLPHADREALKEQITLKIKEANPHLYQDDPGVADIIAMCLREEDRVQHARGLLREINGAWPEVTPVSLLDQLKSLTDPAAALDSGGSALFQAMASSMVQVVLQMLTDMNKGVLDVAGSPPEIRSWAAALLATLSGGDEFLTISIPAFWYPNNIGINGRFLSRCRKAAAQGASIKRVFLLVNEDLSNPYTAQIVAAQLNVANDLDSSLKPNFAVRYVLMSAEARRNLVGNGKHFGLLVKGGHRTAMFPVYDSNDRLVTLRFRSGLREVDGLREAFEETWADSRPLVDLRLPTKNSFNLDLTEKTA